MRSAFIVSTLLLAIALPASAAGPYEILGVTDSRSGNLVRSEWTVQVGDNPMDRFKMVRLVKDVAQDQLKGSILFLPPLAASFALFEVRDEVGDQLRGSAAEFFARRNYDVYGYTPRFVGIPAGTCEAGVLDCAAMADWDIRSMVDDVAFVRSQIELLHPGTRIAVGGQSLGAMVAIATVSAHPDDYDGVFPWEGLLWTEDPGAFAQSQGYCAALDAGIAAGQLFDGVMLNLFQQLIRYAGQDPQGTTPVRLFPPVLSNQLALIAAMSVPTPGPTTMPVPGYVLAAGSLEEGRLLFASELRASQFISYDVYPLAVIRDLHCSIAGDDRYVAGLGDFTGSVLAIGAGHGYGPYMQDQLDLFTGASEVTFLLQEDFGHLDHYLSRQHRNFVERPILSWLEELFP